MYTIVFFILRCTSYYYILRSIIYIPFTFTYYIKTPNNQNILLLVVYAHPYLYAQYVKNEQACPIQLIK